MGKVEDHNPKTKDLKIERIENGKIKMTIFNKLVGVTPFQVIDFVLNLNRERFIRFHPKHHKDYKVLYHPKEGKIGTIIYLKEEYDNGYVSSAKVEIIEAIPGEKFAIKTIAPWWQPITLIGIAESIETGTKITHQVIAGFDFPFFGYFYNRIMKIFLLSKKNLDAIYQHAKEEYKTWNKCFSKKGKRGDAS